MKTVQLIPEILRDAIVKKYGIGPKYEVSTRAPSKYYTEIQSIKMHSLELAVGFIKNLSLTEFILFNRSYPWFDEKNSRVNNLVPPFVDNIFIIANIAGGRIEKNLYVNELQYGISFESNKDFDPSHALSEIFKELSIINSEYMPDDIEKIPLNKLPQLVPLKRG